MNKLFQVLREEFDYVVVDSGRCHGLVQEALFGTADKLYLVTERTFPALRNRAHRLVGCLCSRSWAQNIEVVLNRFDSDSDIDDKHVRKALGRAVNWNIPNAFAAMQKAWDSGVPLAMKASPITAELCQMARAACGKPLSVAKTNRIWSFLDWHARPEPLKI